MIRIAAGLLAHRANQRASQSGVIAVRLTLTAIALVCALEQPLPYRCWWSRHLRDRTPPRQHPTAACPYRAAQGTGRVL